MPRSSRSKSPPSSRRSAVETPLEVLSKLTTELEFYEEMPKLEQQHGKEALDKALRQVLSGSQVRLCYKRLEERQKRLVWMHRPAPKKKGASQSPSELAIIVTDHSLNEVERWESVDAKHNNLDAAAVDFLAAHCTRGTAMVAGLDLSQKWCDQLERELPKAFDFLGGPSPLHVTKSHCLDLCDGGVARYAEMMGLSLLASPEVEKGAPRNAREFATALRRGANPAQKTGPVDAIDHVEAAIMALGWARQNLVSPPAAAQYVVAGMRCFAGFLVLSLAARAYWECV